MMTFSDGLQIFMFKAPLLYVKRIETSGNCYVVPF